MKAGLLTALGTNECTKNENVHTKELKYTRTRTTNGNAHTLQLVLIHTFCVPKEALLSPCVCVCVCVRACVRACVRVCVQCVYACASKQF